MRRVMRAAALAGVLASVPLGMAVEAGLPACLDMRELGVTQAIFSSPIVDGDLERAIRRCPGLNSAENIRYLFDRPNTEGYLIGHSGNCIRWVRHVTLVNLMDLAEHGVCPAKTP